MSLIPWSANIRFTKRDSIILKVNCKTNLYCPCGYQCPFNLIFNTIIVLNELYKLNVQTTMIRPDRNYDQDAIHPCGALQGRLVPRSATAN